MYFLLFTTQYPTADTLYSLPVHLSINTAGF
jgi:hypothetical protein